MEKLKQKIKQIKEYPLIIIFFSIIFIIFIIDIFTPQNEYSNIENRFLQEKPEFSFEDFIKNKFVTKYELYINDQFVFRDKWISTKSRMEHYFGKLENNNIVYGSDGYMFDKVQSIDKNQLEKNITSLNKFCNRYKDLNITVGLIPNSYEVLKDKLPWGLELYNQTDLIDKVYRDVLDNRAKTLDILNIMKQNKDKYIYYKTDHHWTTLGAYYAYDEYIKSMNEYPVDIDKLKKQEVNYFIGTYFSKSKKYNTNFDVINYYDIDIDGVYINDKKYKSMYDLDKFKQRDKYGAFIRGNNDLTVIKNKTNSNVNKTNSKRILLIKDSFGNSFAPFLTFNYDEVYIVDLRYNTERLSSIIKDTSFDNILILYSVNNFINDVNFSKINF